MNHKHNGFAALEAVLIAVVLGALAWSGYLAWRHYSPTGGHNPSPQSSNTPQPGWTTYKSSHASLHFNYPPSWKLTKGSTNSVTLESIKLAGPNNFQLSFQLQAKHVDPSMSCAITRFGTVVPLNANYVIVPTLDVQNTSMVESINLMASNPYKGSSSQEGCGLGFYPNPVSENMGFVFSGAYIKPVGASGGTYIEKSASDYFNQPEVQTAKAIFASLSQ